MLLIPLYLSLLCLIFFSTTVPASPAPVVYKIMPSAFILELNQSVLIADTDNQEKTIRSNIKTFNIFL